MKLVDCNAADCCWNKCQKNSECNSQTCTCQCQRGYVGGANHCEKIDRFLVQEFFTETHLATTVVWKDSYKDSNSNEYKVKSDEIGKIFL